MPENEEIKKERKKRKTSLLGRELRSLSSMPIVTAYNAVESKEWVESD